MDLPLQPPLRPSPYWYRRSIILLSLLALVLSLGFIQRPNDSHQRMLGNDQQEYLKTISQRINSAEERIWCMFYVMRRGDNLKHPVNYVSKLLVDAHQRGVDVRVVLDISDPEATYPGPDNSPSISYFKQHGVRVFTDEIDRTTHAKIMLFDNDVIIGSHNWTSWALTKNREISVISNDEILMHQIESLFEEFE